MWIADGWRDYELLDCGGGEKLERWGRHLLVRPDPQAIWPAVGRNPGWTRPDGGTSAPAPAADTGTRGSSPPSGRSAIET